MKKDQVLGIIRHILTFAGGIVVAKGVVEQEIIQEVSGSLVTLIGAIWSILSKK
jgi:hypothetical protein